MRLFTIGIIVLALVPAVGSQMPVDGSLTGGSWHQKHRGEGIGTLFNLRWRPRPAGDRERYSGFLIKQKMTQLMSQGKPPPRRGEVLLTLRIHRDRGAESLPA